MAWQKLGTETNTGTSDPVTVTLSEAKIFNLILSHLFLSGSVNGTLRVGTTTIDTGSNYAGRISSNGAADVAQINQVFMINQNAPDGDDFNITYIINISGEEKLGINFTVGRNTAGAVTAPKRTESVGKWDITSGQLDIVEIFDQGAAGSYLVDSNLSGLGTD